MTSPLYTAQQLFQELKKIIPELSDNTISMKLEMDLNTLPKLTVTTLVEQPVPRPVKTTKTFELREINPEDGGDYRGG